jgi:hypothetical protein
MWKLFYAILYFSISLAKVAMDGLDKSQREEFEKGWWEPMRSMLLLGRFVYNIV